EDGDVFLICSDGLTDMVGDGDILGVIEKHRRDLDRAARELVGAANRGGGEDNITVVAFEIVSDGADAEETVRLPAASAGGDGDEDTLDDLDNGQPADTTAIPP